MGGAVNINHKEDIMWYSLDDIINNKCTYHHIYCYTKNVWEELVVTWIDDVNDPQFFFLLFCFSIQIVQNVYSLCVYTLPSPIFVTFTFNVKRMFAICILIFVHLPVNCVHFFVFSSARYSHCCCCYYYGILFVCCCERLLHTFGP